MTQTLPTSCWHFYLICLLRNVDIWRTTYLPPFVNIVFGCPLTWMIFKVKSGHGNYIFIFFMIFRLEANRENHQALNKEGIPEKERVQTAWVNRYVWIHHFPFFHFSSFGMYSVLIHELLKIYSCPCLTTYILLSHIYLWSFEKV